ncbi:MAG: AAA family ATPase [Ruminococcaceae bacterium]|nr:AAA family ATPase [Oscillospiraceae bacterium]
MGYNQENFRRIREEYSRKYLEVQEAASKRREEIHAILPEVKEIDSQLSDMGLRIMQAALQSEDYQAALAEIEEQSLSLEQRRAEVLTRNGFSANYTAPRYECAACGDTGYIDYKMCDCMRKKLILAGYESSGIGTLMQSQSFENFSLDYYKADRMTYLLMQSNLERAKEYAKTFHPARSENLAMFGDTGLGKTHLSTAIAREVIEGGWDVVYVSCLDMFADYEAQRFGNSTGTPTGADTSRYTECDLLIIDDLGTELTNQFTTSCLYGLLNTRLNRHLPVILSTNLETDEFRKRYWDRITSRVLGNFTVMRFKGTDIRRQKLSK